MFCNQKVKQMNYLNLSFQKFSILAKSVMMVSLVFLAFSCEDENTDPPANLPTENIMEIVDGNDDVATLKAAIDAAGLRTTLEGDGPFTVFAPTDAAFTALEMANPGIIDYLLENTEELTKVLTYHVVAGNVLSTDLTSGDVPTLNGENVTIDLSNGVMVNDATVTGADVLATNGVIHVINKVLVPSNLVLPEPVDQKIMEIVDATAAVSTLKTAIDVAMLRETLDGDGPFTVFAPSDEAFTDFSADNPGVLEFLLANPDELAKVLTYHVVAGKVFSSDLTNGNVATVNGGEVVVDITNGVTINGAIVTGADIEATNGIIHLIDEVLVPSNVNIPDNLNADGTQQTIMQFVDANAEVVSTLKAAIDAASLRETLDGAGPFTVFAPSDDAFAAFSEANPGVLEFLLANPAELSKVLTYHVVANEVFSTDLSAGDVVTVNGESVTVALTDGDVLINNAEVTDPDLDVANGVIHAIDQVLVPSNVNIPANLNPDGTEMTIADLAIATEDLSTLVSILSLDGLSGILAAADDPNATLTVFAPTNEAFAGVLTALGLTSIDEIPESVLLDIVQYHIVGSVAKSTDLMAQGYETLNGESVTVDLSNGVMVDDATVLTPDVIGANGVVHVVDAVLLPSLYKGALGTIVEYPLFRKDYTTLIAAVKAASPSILTTLLGNGPSDGGLTLFAPTNAAFEAAGITALPDMATLDAVLTYHVIDGTILAAGLPATAVAAPATVPTLGGDIYLSNRGNDAGVFINGSTQVTMTDIERDNGVVHVIDQTLVPASMSIAALATDLGFTKLVDALTEAGLAQTFVDPGNFTVFAPTDAAFDALYGVLGVTTPAEIDDATLDAVLKYHVINGARVFSTDLEDALAPTTLQGTTLTINVTGNGVSITDNDPESANANVVATDVLATNGVVHAIDAVILPVDVAANNN
jgi:transforming growth factor-beta-induced protein